MARISYETFQQKAAEQELSNTGIGFFSLKDDGDEAIVRIMHDSSADYDILTTHQVQVNGKYTQVECLDGHCPLCNSGAKIRYRFFVHMIQYVKDEQGNIVAKPVVWDRAAKAMSEKLNAMMQEYGPLSDCVFKIRRNGKAQDMHTTYEIMFANPNVYRPDLYPKDTEVFKDYTVSGKQVANKTADEMNTFLRTGNFPERQSANTDTAQSANYDTNANVAPQTAPTGYNTVAPAQPATGRPNRYY
jgi:hypothetical protein